MLISLLKESVHNSKIKSHCKIQNTIPSFILGAKTKTTMDPLISLLTGLRVRWNHPLWILHHLVHLIPKLSFRIGTNNINYSLSNNKFKKNKLNNPISLSRDRYSGVPKVFRYNYSHPIPMSILPSIVKLIPSTLYFPSFLSNPLGLL